MPAVVTKIPGYVVQPACANCKHVFVASDCDSGYEYFCTKNAPPRPWCGSVAMKEAFSDTKPIPENATVEDYQRHHEEVFVPASKAWDEWAQGREVEPHGFCPEYDA